MKKIMQHKKIVLLVAIVLFGFLIRIFRLDQISLYGDELTIVYDAYSLLKNGTDQLGNPWPVTFQMGAGRPPGYVYGSIPFVAIFGPTIWGVRMLSILSGIGLIIMSYLLVKGLELDKKIHTWLGIGVALLVAISPWAVNLSRGGFESNFALFLVISGITGLMFAKSKPFLLIVAALCFSIAIHTYPTFKLTLPLIVILLSWYLKIWHYFFIPNLKKYMIITLAILFFAAIISLWQTFTGGSESRFLTINIFNEPTINKLITENVIIERNLGDSPSSLEVFLHNRYIAYPKIFLTQYFESLSIGYLFIHGDGNPRHNMTQSGTLFIVEIITILAGIIFLFKREKRIFFLLIFWILIAPIATSLLAEVHTLRNSLLFLPLTIVSAIGMITLITQIEKKKKIFYAIPLLLIFIIQLVFIYEKLFFVAPNLFSRYWANPAKQISEQIIKESKNYDMIIVLDSIDNIEYAYPVYAKIDPKITVNAEKNRVMLNEHKFKQFGNVYIGGIADGNVSQFLTRLPERVLYIGTSEQKKYLENYQIINGKDNIPSYLTVKK